jgi:hypothetical protein
MKAADHLDQMTNAIANSIVELVERTDGPVTLARIKREIPGFAKQAAPAWAYVVEHDEGEMLIWDGMTEGGLAALRRVVGGREVAIQYVNHLPYLAEDCLLDDESWVPIVLLPKSAANLNTPNWLVRASQGGRDHCIARAGKEGRGDYQPLTARPLRFTADQFATA